MRLLVSWLWFPKGAHPDTLNEGLEARDGEKEKCEAERGWPGLAQQAQQPLNHANTSHEPQHRSWLPSLVIQLPANGSSG